MEAVAHAPLAIAKLFSVAGKTAVVTGGGRGIGEMIARTFVENGARVYIASRSAETLRRTAERLTAAGPGTCVPLAEDLSTEAGCASFAKVCARAARNTSLVGRAEHRSWTTRRVACAPYV